MSKRFEEISSKMNEINVIFNVIFNVLSTERSRFVYEPALLEARRGEQWTQTNNIFPADGVSVTDRTSMDVRVMS